MLAELFLVEVGDKLDNRMSFHVVGKNKENRHSEGPLGRATPPPAIYDPESCGSDRQKWSAHQDRPIADDGLNWLDIC